MGERSHGCQLTVIAQKQRTSKRLRMEFASVTLD